MADAAENTAAKPAADPPSADDLPPLEKLQLEESRYEDPRDYLLFDPFNLLEALAQHDFIPRELFVTPYDIWPALNRREVQQIFILLQGALGGDLCYHVPAPTAPRPTPPSIGFIVKELTRHGLLMPHIQAGGEAADDQPPMDEKEAVEFMMQLLEKRILISVDDLSEHGREQKEAFVEHRTVHINAAICHMSLLRRCRGHIPLTTYEQRADVIYRRELMEWPADPATLGGMGNVPFCHVMRMLDAMNITENCPCESCAAHDCWDDLQSPPTLPFPRLIYPACRALARMLLHNDVVAVASVQKVCPPVMNALERLQLGGRPLNRLHHVLKRKQELAVKVHPLAQARHGPADIMFEQLRFIVAEAVLRRRLQSAD